MNIYQKIAEVMKEVGFLTNDVTVGSGSYAFKAISETKVTLAVRNSLINNGLIIYPVEQIHHREDGLYPNKDGVAVLSRISTVDVKYRIVDIDDETFIEVASSGTGVDANDKGVGKAISYAYKYMLLKTFAIPTGEEKDNKIPIVPAKKVIVNKPDTREEIPANTGQKAELTTKQLNQAIVRIEKGEFTLVEILEENFVVTPGQKEHLEQSINYAKRQLAEKELVNV
jgi:hypothetical protein